MHIKSTKISTHKILEELSRQTGCKPGLYAASLSEVSRYLELLAPLGQQTPAETVDQD